MATVFDDMLIKLAYDAGFRAGLGADFENVDTKLKTELLPHQLRVVERLRELPGLVVAHGLGSGKTLSSLAAAADVGGDVTALVPASLQANYAKEIKKHMRGRTHPDIISQQLASLRGKLPSSDLLIVDEAHRARETETKLYKLLQDAEAEKRLLLTASPVYNRPSDIAPLVNLAAGSNVLPLGSSFEDKFIQKPSRSLLGAWFGGATEPTLKNTKKLKDILSRWVDYHPATGGDYPATREKRIPVEMTPRQTELHDAAWDQLPWLERMRLQASLPPTKKNLARLNAFQSQARQIAGSEAAFTTGERDPSQSPKIMRAFKEFQRAAKKNPEHRALVYSNYLNTLRDYSTLLERENVPYGLFTGEQTPKERKQIVDDYNAGLLKALLVSSAGGEGLDLQGTRQVQVLEPHWNEEKLKQVIGRAVRHGSHAHLPEDQRVVDIQKFEAYPRAGLSRKLLSAVGLMDKKPTGVEQVLYNVAEQKERLNKALVGLLEDAQENRR